MLSCCGLFHASSIGGRGLTGDWGDIFKLSSDLFTFAPKFLFCAVPRQIEVTQVCTDSYTPEWKDPFSECRFFEILPTFFGSQRPLFLVSLARKAVSFRVLAACTDTGLLVTGARLIEKRGKKWNQETYSLEDASSSFHFFLQFPAFVYFSQFLCFVTGF